MTEQMRNVLIRLIASLDDEEGVSEATYDAIGNLLACVCGSEVAQKFRDYIDATEGRFYLQKGTGKEVAMIIMRDK